MWKFLCIGFYLLPCFIAQPAWALDTITDSSIQAIAFPGAEGFGKFTTGGRGGRLYRVTNLANSGPGSFRMAAEATEKRIIIFCVAGTIHLSTKVNIKGNVTIAGQSAPGEGICLADQPVQIGGDNVIIRYIRFRMGDKYQQPLKVDGNGADDALSASRRKNIIIDHCSLSWSTDECFSIYAGDSTTLQWNLIAEPLNYSYHFEKGDQDFEKHGYGAIWGGAHLTAHHNLFAHCKSRTPRFNGIRSTPDELVDFRNNVIYNWGNNNVYGGEGGRYNIVANFYKYGPETDASVMYQLVNPGKTQQITFGKWFVAENFIDGSEGISNDNKKGIRFLSDNKEEQRAAVIDKAHSVIEMPTESALSAFKQVIKWVGSSYKRDTLDTRIILDVLNRSGKFIDVQGGFAHGTNYQLSQFAWPQLQSGELLIDTDEDGMPDSWEKSKGLNPLNSSDAILCSLHTYYTNIEYYLNSILE